MWLLYLRFDDNGEVKTYHVRTGSKVDVLELLAMADPHGLTPTRDWSNTRRSPSVVRSISGQ